MSNDVTATVAAEQPPIAQEQQAEEQLKPTDTAEVPPQPAEETSEEKEARKAAKIQRRIDQLTRKAYEAEARAEAIERMYAQKSQTAQVEENVDPAAFKDQVLEEVRREFEVKAVEQKKNDIFAKAGVDRQEFAENVPVLSRQMAETIMDSDIAPKIVKYLNENPEEADRIAAMPQSRHGAEIGKLELKLSATPAVKKTSAPAPIKPVTAAKIVEDPSPESTEDWIEWRNKQKRRG